MIKKEITDLVSEKLNLNESNVMSALRLLEEGGTIPFVARYRKEETGGLTDMDIANIVKEYKSISHFISRKNTIINGISSQGKLDDELMKKIDSCTTLAELEDIYLPFKPKKFTRGSSAREAGLEVVSLAIRNDEEVDYTKYINKETPYDTPEKVKNGACDIIAEDISLDSDIRAYIKKIMFESGCISTALAKAKKDPKKKYQQFYDSTIMIKNIKTYQYLAINRAWYEEVIRYKFIYPDEDIITNIYNKYFKNNKVNADLLKTTVIDSYERLIKPSINNFLSSYLFDKAQTESLTTFESSLRDILMKPPYRAKRILGFDPGYHHGCKLVVIDGNGNVLKTDVIYPTTVPGNVQKYLTRFIDLLKKFDVEIIALGNGTATREAEDFIKEALKEVKDCTYEVVSEDGASIYSVSKLAQQEFPNYDPNLRSSVSIARRLLDPLAELVKVEPSGLGVGQYQHDMDEKKLRECLNNVVYKTVNDVGVNVNTSSKSLLSYVSGINKTIADNIFEHIKTKGDFKSREELRQVKGFGAKAFENAAGFLRIDGSEPLDMTSIHPESYEKTYKLLNELGLKFPQDLEKIKNLDLTTIKNAATRIGISTDLALDIYKELTKDMRDPRGEAIKIERNNKYRSIEDLVPGAILTGVISNITDFGCFVDIGVHVSGLVHISKISNSYVNKENIRDFIRVGQVIKVKVLEVDIDRQRINLSIKDVKE